MFTNNRKQLTVLPRRSKRRGAVLIYVLIMMSMFFAMCSLAVDYGHVQLVKTEMQRSADASARAYMVFYNMNGQGYADSHIAAMYATAQNPVDSKSGRTPTVTVQFGSWNVATNTFSAGAGTIPAVKVTETRIGAANGVQLMWGSLIGVSSIDVHASAVAALMGSSNVNVNVSSNADLYFAGMPNTTTDPFGDNFTNNAPYQVPTIAVTPGTYITFTNLSGTSSVVPGTVPASGPAGSGTYIVSHGQNWDGTMYYPGSENGIADAKIPEDALTGLFLTNSAPNLSTAPAGQVDWSNPSQSDQAVYSNIQVAQPFMVGAGTTTGGTVKQFLVPPGATRLYMAIWDGVDYANNAGTINGTVTVKPYVQLVQ